MYLENLSAEITKEGNHIEVTYSLNEKSGTCKYVIKPSTSLLLVEVNMKGIIEEINKIFPLKDGGLLSLQMEIREDSLNRITQWENQGPYQS